MTDTKVKVRRTHELHGKNLKQWARELGVNINTLYRKIAANGGVFDESCLQRKPYFVRGVAGGKSKPMSRIGNQYRNGNNGGILRGLERLAKRMGKNVDVSSDNGPTVTRDT